MTPRVCVVMPAFNAARFIEESIASVQAQSFQNWELVVVDDGSTDDTAQIVASFVTTDQRIRLIQQPNIGQAGARNTAIRSTKAPWIAFLDADDLWITKKLETQLKAMESRETDVMFSDGFIFTEDNSQKTSTFNTLRGVWSGREFLVLSLASNRIPILSALVRRASVENVGGFDERREVQTCEDFDLWLRLAQSGATFQGLDAMLVRYRRHDGAMTMPARRIAHLKAELETLRAFLAPDAELSAIAKARTRTLYHVVALELVAQNQRAEAVCWMRLPRTRDFDSRAFAIQRSLFSRAPRTYRIVYKALARLKRIIKRSS